MKFDVWTVRSAGGRDGEQTRHTDQRDRPGGRTLHRRSEEHDFSRKALADGAMALASHTGGRPERL